MSKGIDLVSLLGTQGCTLYCNGGKRPGLGGLEDIDDGLHSNVSLAQLERSVNNGCGFCRLMRNAILSLCPSDSRISLAKGRSSDYNFGSELKLEFYGRGTDFGWKKVRYGGRIKWQGTRYTRS